MLLLGELKPVGTQANDVLIKAYTKFCDAGSCDILLLKIVRHFLLSLIENEEK
jgi:hypothetical protein